MRHSVLETWLTKRGVAYAYHETISLDTIDVDDAAKENIRLGVPLNDERVQTYGLELAADAKFPAIVLWRWKGTRFVVVNGLHRLAAYRIAERKSTDAYVIDSVDPVLLEVLRRTINVIEGEPLSMEQRIEHAMRLIELQHTARDAARLTAVPVNRLNSAVALARVRPRLERGGVKVSELHVTGPQLAVLNAIQRDRHLIDAVKLAHEARLSADEIRELVKEIRGAEDDTAADGVTREWRDRYADVIARSQKGAIRPPGSPIRRLGPLFAQTDRIISQGAAQGAKTLGQGELTHMIAQTKAYIGRLQTFLVALQKAKRKGKVA